MAQTTLRLEYSAFFSSGLLAQHTTPQKKVNNSESFSWDATFDHSPSRPSSPIPIPDGSLMDIDMASYNDRRSITPTPQTRTPIQSPQPVKIQQATSQQQQPPTKLRKRRSSLTLATSPMNTIRSPSRAANNALHLQRQLFGPVVSSSRSRSGSLSGEDATASRFSSAGVASTETSLGGRLRSGSFGCSGAVVVPPPAPLRRRPIRRLHISALQTPLAPPPTIPLPALPPHSNQQQHFRPTNLNTPTTRTAHTKVSSISSTSTTSARARGLSVSSSTLDGDEHRIDEDMKEN